VLEEPESDVLKTQLQPLERPITSELAYVEVALAARRALGESGLDQARAVLASSNLVPYVREIRELAATELTPGLRTLDAIHLATALSVRSIVDAFVCYDRRLGEAATAAGLTVLSPGAAV
jgi:predicted nucleic acid-binding protein